MKERPWYQFYDPGVTLTPTYSTVPLKEQFLQWVKKQPQKPFIYYLNEVLTYKQINELACKLANGMLGKGVKKGDRVAIVLPNIPEFIISVHACLKIGAILVPMNPRYTKRELTYQFIDSGSETIICLENSFALIREIMHENRSIIKRIIIVSDTCKSYDDESLHDYRDFIKNSVDLEPQVQVLPDDLVLLMYTGGTTGLSKGCCITNMNLIAVASGWEQMCRYFTDMDYYKLLSSTPFYHIHGFQSAVNSNILIGIVKFSAVFKLVILGSMGYAPKLWLGY